MRMLSKIIFIFLVSFSFLLVFSLNNQTEAASCDGTRKDFDLSLNIDKEVYQPGKTITGNISITNNNGEALVELTLNLFKDNVLFWSRAENLTISPKTSTIDLATAFGFTPTIPYNDMLVGNWKLEFKARAGECQWKADDVFEIKQEEPLPIIACGDGIWNIGEDIYNCPQDANEYSIPPSDTINVLDTGDYTVGVYIFPAWHRDTPPELKEYWKPVIDANIYISGQEQPKKPIMNYYDDTNPVAIDWMIKWGLEHGVNLFVYDWYAERYFEKPLNVFLERFNSKYSQYKDKAKFTLLWANHNMAGIDTVEKVLEGLDDIEQRYFRNSQYFKIDNQPVFIIFDLGNLLNVFGEQGTNNLFKKMKARMKEKGYNGLYIVLTNDWTLYSPEPLALDAITGYNYWFYAKKPVDTYDNFINVYREMWERLYNNCQRLRNLEGKPIDYITPVTPGWDNTPWKGSDGSMVIDSTPDKFKSMLQNAKQFIKEKKLQKIVIIGAWDEWAEGSILAPRADKWGFGYLEAVKSVFGGVIPPSPTCSQISLGVNVDKDTYKQRETITGNIAVNNNVGQKVPLDLSLGLYKKVQNTEGKDKWTLFWQRKERIDIPSGTSTLPLDKAFGFTPKIPYQDFVLGEWKLKFEGSHKQEGYDCQWEAEDEVIIKRAAISKCPYDNELQCRKWKKFHDEGFNFAIPWNDSDSLNPERVISASDLLDAPAGKYGHLIVKDGHFYFENKLDESIKFHGVSLGYGINFLPKEATDILVEKLAKMGINLVRLVLMDDIICDYPENTIFKDGGCGETGTREFDEGQLDKMDYLISKLKEKGIYVFFSPKGFSKFSENDGLKYWQQAYQGVLFDKELINFNKEFFFNLFNHYNPYTGLKYKNEPTIALMDIYNENSWLFYFAHGYGPSEYPTIFYLVAKASPQQFPSNTVGWFLSSTPDYLNPPDTNEKKLIRYSDTYLWYILYKYKNEMDKYLPPNQPTKDEVIAIAKTIVNEYRGAMEAARKDPKLFENAVNMLLNMNINNFKNDAKKFTKFLKNVIYKDEEKNTEINLFDYLMEYGEGTDYYISQLDKKWIEFLKNKYRTDENLRKSWQSESQQNQISLYNFETLSGENILRHPVKYLVDDAQNKLWSKNRVRDLTEFYYEIDRKYFTEMYNYLKNKIGVKTSITSTNTAWGGLPGLKFQKEFDFIDIHPYKATEFKGVEYPHKSISEDDSRYNALLEISIARIFNKPLTMSEWNYTLPTDKRYEAPMMMAAYASLQDADAIIYHAFAHNIGQIVDGMITNEGLPNRPNYEIVNDPSIESQFPLAARVFLNGYIQKARPTQGKILDYTNDQVFYSIYEYGVPSTNLGYSNIASVTHWIENVPAISGLIYPIIKRDFNAPKPVKYIDDTSKYIDEEKGIITSATGELKWNYKDKIITANSPYAQIVINSNGDPVDGSDTSIELDYLSIENMKNLGTISLVSLDGRILPNSNKMLISVVGEAQNYPDLFNFNPHGGEVRILGIPVTIKLKNLNLPENTKCWILDEVGNKKSECKLQGKPATQKILELTGKENSVWFLLER